MCGTDLFALYQLAYIKLVFSRSQTTHALDWTFDIEEIVNSLVRTSTSIVFAANQTVTTIVLLCFPLTSPQKSIQSFPTMEELQSRAYSGRTLLLRADPKKSRYVQDDSLKGNKIC